MCTKKDTKVWTLAIAAGHPPLLRRTCCDQEGVTFLPAYIKQALEKKTQSERLPCGGDSDQKPHQVRLWSPPFSCCPSPKPFNLFKALKLTCPQSVSPHMVSAPWLINALLSCSANLFVPLWLVSEYVYVVWLTDTWVLTSCGSGQHGGGVCPCGSHMHVPISYCRCHVMWTDKHKRKEMTGKTFYLQFHIMTHVQFIVHMSTCYYSYQ